MKSDGLVSENRGENHAYSIMSGWYDLTRNRQTVLVACIVTEPLMSSGHSVAATHIGKPFFAVTALPPRLVSENTMENHCYSIVSQWYDLPPIVGRRSSPPSAPLTFTRLRRACPPQAD